MSHITEATSTVAILRQKRAGMHRMNLAHSNLGPMLLLRVTRAPTLVPTPLPFPLLPPFRRRRRAPSGEARVVAAVAGRLIPRLSFWAMGPQVHGGCGPDLAADDGMAAR